MSRLEQLHKMLESDPQDVFLNYGLAMEFIKLGRREEALAQFERVTQIDAKHVPAYFQRANLLVAMSRKDEAKQVFASALAAAEQAGDRHAATEIREALTLMG